MSSAKATTTAKKAGHLAERVCTVDISVNGDLPAGITAYLEKMAGDGWALVGVIPDGGANYFIFSAK